MAVRKQIVELVVKNKILLTYLLFILLVPIFCSSWIVYHISENYYFFYSLKWIDISIVFVFLSFTMAFGLTPTTFICFLSGFLWGWMSILFIIPSYLIAQFLGFQLARLIDGDKFVNNLKMMNKIPDYLLRLHQNQQQIIFFCRLSPVLPFGLMNVVLSIFKVDFGKFMVFGFLGMMPRTLLVIWLGTQTDSLIKGLNDNIGYKIIFIGLTILSIVGIGRIFKKSLSSNVQ